MMRYNHNYFNFIFSYIRNQFGTETCQFLKEFCNLIKLSINVRACIRFLKSCINFNLVPPHLKRYTNTRSLTLYKITEDFILTEDFREYN